MKKRFNKYFPLLFITGEVIVISLLFLFAYYIAFGSFALQGPYETTFLIYVILWPLLSYFKRDFKIGRAVSYYSTFKKAFSSAFIFVSIISLGWLFIAGDAISRHFIMSLVLLLFVWITIYRVFVHLILDRYRAFGGNIRYASIIGYDQLTFNLYNVLEKKPHYGIRCNGFYTLEDGVEANENYPIAGSINELLSGDLANIDFLYISEKVDRPTLNKIIERADNSLVRVKLLPEFRTDFVKTFSLKRFGTVPVVDINNLPLDSLWNTVVKRSFDLIFSLLMLIFIMSWMYPLFGLIIKLESKGPILFKQLRHGKGNTPFYCYKFRTMIVNEQSDVLWASKGDPRITKFGAFLRKTSLDEFPQFFNVLIGNMSIVGPRPHPLSLNHTYEDRIEKFSRRHASKPGVTGLAQAMGYRGEIVDYYQMNSRVRLDRFYLQNWSFWLDVKIILLTVYALIRGQELAY